MLRSRNPSSITQKSLELVVMFSEKKLKKKKPLRAHLVFAWIQFFNSKINFDSQIYICRLVFTVNPILNTTT